MQDAKCVSEEIPWMIAALDRMFEQLEPWDQDPEDRRSGDISDFVIVI